MSDRDRKGTIMGKLFGEVKPAVKKETKRIAGMMLVGVVLMWIGFAILHKLLPDTIGLFLLS